MITDPNIHLMIELSICDRLSYVAQCECVTPSPTSPQCLITVQTCRRRTCSTSSATCSIPLPNVSATGWLFPLSHGRGTDRKRANRLANRLLCRVRPPLSRRTPRASQCLSACARTRAHRQRDAQRHAASLQLMQDVVGQIGTGEVEADPPDKNFQSPVWGSSSTLSLIHI